MAKAAKKSAARKSGRAAPKAAARSASTAVAGASAKRKSRVPSKLDPRKSDLSHQKIDRKTGEKLYATRADKGAPVDVAINRMPEPQRTIAWALDKEIRKLSSNIDSKVAWGHAGYWVDGHDLFALCERKDYVSLMVGNGALLRDAGGLLEGTGQRMRHIKIRTIEQAKSNPVVAILRDAFAQAKAGKLTAWDTMKRPK